MNQKQLIVDTGALVALLDRSDYHHVWAVDCFKVLRPPLHTCESVLTEAWHLLGHAPGSRQVLSDFCREGILEVTFRLEDELSEVLALLKKYADTPMDFADACLVRMVENTAQPVVWTVDSDFRVYRRKNRRLIPLLAPWD